MIFQKNHKHFTAAGWALIGLGFLFLGIAYMKDGFEAVSGGVDLSQYAVPGFRGLLIDAAEIVFANLYSTEKDMELTAAETDLSQSNNEEIHADAVVTDRQPGS